MRAIVTGSCGLVGYTTCSRLLKDNWRVDGIDNDRRAFFFGEAGSTDSSKWELMRNPWYTHHIRDIRSEEAAKIVKTGADLIVHCAAQPSHDWAAKNIEEDFTINAIGTLNLLKAYHEYCYKANRNVPFIHVSTSKVYGDNPNWLEFEELETRWEVKKDHPLWNGIPETFSVDQCLHSFFGVSKLSGDLLAQEFGRYYGLPVGIFRPGCITGSQHKGVELHGFLQYLAQCVALGKEYRVYGYKGKQVRCNVHADDLVEAFLLYAEDPKPGAVYNVGGRGLDCSLQEAVTGLETRLGRKAQLAYVEEPRRGDHRWWVSDSRRLRGGARVGS